MSTGLARDRKINSGCTGIKLLEQQLGKKSEFAAQPEAAHVKKKQIG